MRNYNPRAHHSGLSSHNCRMIAISENPLPDDCRAGKFKLGHDAVESEDGARLCTADALPTPGRNNSVGYIRMFGRIPIPNLARQGLGRLCPPRLLGDED